MILAPSCAYALSFRTLTACPAPTSTRFMHALRLTPQGLTLETAYPVPETGREQARVKVALAGICATDLELEAGYMQNQSLVLGHEFVGVVDSCPDAPHWEGRRVVGEINIGCRRCADCRRREFRHCPARSCLGILKHDGAFAEYLTLPIVNLHAVPSNVENEVAVFTEPMAAALRLQEQLTVATDAQIAVVGTGKLGLLIALALQDRGCRLTAFGRHAKGLDLLRARSIEAVDVPRGAETDAILGRERTYDAVVECAASPAAYAMVQALVKPLGAIVLKSTLAATGHLDLNALVVNEIRVIGSRCGPFDQALSWLERTARSGWFPTTELIAEVRPLTEARQAFERARQSGVLKVLLRP